MLANRGEVIRGIYEQVHPNEDDRSQMDFEIPFLNNLAG